MDRRKVVIIDDDIGTLRLMEKQLKVLYDVECFRSGKQALKKIGGVAKNLSLSFLI